MKLPDFKLAQLVPVVMVVGMLVIGLWLIRSVTDGSEYQAMLETPVRDMKMGQLIGLVVFAWVLFR